MTCDCDRLRRQIAEMQDKRYHTDEITQQNMATLSNPSSVMAEREAIHAHPADQ